MYIRACSNSFDFCPTVQISLYLYYKCLVFFEQINDIVYNIDKVECLLNWCQIKSPGL